LFHSWAIVASATVLGSTCSFLASRYFLKSYVTRMTASNKRFMALSLALKDSGLKLLIMIRLCPLPYSFSNGAISTIPSVDTKPFMLATALATPKLLLHVFIGDRIAEINRSGDKMDFRTKMVSYVSIAIGMTAGVAVGWLMYNKTAARARELEAEEAENARSGPGRRSGGDNEDDLEAGGDAFLDGDDADEDPFAYADDPAESEAAKKAVRPQDGISLHTANSRSELRGQTPYRDDDEEEGDAASLDDVFRAGDGDTDDEERYRDDEAEENAWR